VPHEKGQYVIGAVHANTIEGLWSIFKRGVVGTFHKMSERYMLLLRRDVSVSATTTTAIIHILGAAIAAR
jgi:hypothetical protein